MLAPSGTAGQAPNHPALVRGRFHPAPYVVSVRAGGATVLMDRKRGRYFTLNQASGRVWDLVGEGKTALEICQRLREEYDVPVPRLEEDVASTLQRLLGDRLISTRATPTSASEMPVATSNTTVTRSSGKFRVPTVLQCGLMILALKTMLKTWGACQTFEWVRRRVQAVPIRTDLDPRIVKQTEYRVAAAAALYPGRAKCLEQSLVLYYTLRRAGVAVQFRTGVQPFPFLAHAWIEYRNEVINDVPEHTKWFACLPDELP